MALLIGYAQQDITPSLDQPAYLAGFSQNRLAESIHDPLSARVMALMTSSQRFALISCDLIGLGRNFCKRVKSRLEAVLPGVNLVVASTHTHHGPDTLGLWGPDETIRGVDPHYLENLESLLVSAVLAAFKEMAPVEMRSASLEVPGLARNFRDPQILDQELACLQFCNPGNGAPLVTFLDFPCHPEVLSSTNPHITPDYPYYLRLEVEQKTGVPCLFCAGALGGMMSPDVKDHSFPEAAHMGSVLAEAALQALARAPIQAVEQFTYHQAEYEIPLQSPLLEQALASGLLLDAQLHGKAIQSEVGLLKIGSAWLAHVPGELLPGLGLLLKEKMRQAGAGTPAIIGLANDETGYILPDESYTYPDDPFQPGDHYEETMSIGPLAGSLLMKAFLPLIQA